jgi:RNA polymerase sigma-70 factor (ECF subfamily)
LPWDAPWPKDPDAARRYVSSLYSLKKSHLFRIVLSLTAAASDAEEITQEAFLRLHSHLRAGHELSGDPMNWLVSVARHLAIDRARKAKRESTQDESGWRATEQRLPALDPSPEAQALLTDQQRETARLLETLQGLERECLLLRLRGVTFLEISRTLNVSLSAAVEHANRAIAKVKRRVRK